jgi:acetylornithine deacetylase/succinyl-diaminopimelate desuccinylase-like protein
MRHVAQIAQRPHPMGTADHDRVRDYIIGQLSTIGLHAEIQQATAIGTRYRRAGRVQNYSCSAARQRSGRRRVLIMAHYDGVEAGPGRV